MCTLSACHFVSNTVHSIKYIYFMFLFTIVELILLRMYSVYNNVQLIDML